MSSEEGPANGFRVETTPEGLWTREEKQDSDILGRCIRQLSMHLTGGMDSGGATNELKAEQVERKTLTRFVFDVSARLAAGMWS